MNSKTKQSIITYVKTNWKSIVFVIAIAFLLLFNVKQYQASQSILMQNQKINLQYEAMLQREVIYNEQIAGYKLEIFKRDSLILSEKNRVEQTENQLSISQQEARRLSNKIRSLSTGTQEGVQEYVKTCDSLSIVAPILANQVDTLKKQNKNLVTSLESKSVLQDSIISKKDLVIKENKVTLENTLKSYNEASKKLSTVESRLNKEKKRKSFWRKLSIGLTLGILGVFSVNK